MSDRPKRKPRAAAPDPPPAGSVPQGVRPTSFDQYIGQAPVVAQLDELLSSAVARGAASVDHILLAGPSGTGKTTLAGCIATALGGNLRATSAVSLRTVPKMSKFFAKVEPGDVVFIDECHSLTIDVQDELGIIMDADDGIGWTLIGATTAPGDLEKAFVGRMRVKVQLSYYSVEDLAKIVQRAAGVLGVDLRVGAALAIGRRSCGEARRALGLLNRVRDHAIHTAGLDAAVTVAVVEQACVVQGLDGLGLNALERAYVVAACTEMAGEPIGVARLAAYLGETNRTITRMLEPPLIHLGLITMTPRGRRPTVRAYEHLGMRVPPMAMAA